MRTQTYRLFELVAWPAAAWCGVEMMLRAASTNFDGFAMTAATGALAALTVAACRWRAKELERAPARND